MQKIFHGTYKRKRLVLECITRCIVFKAELQFERYIFQNQICLLQKPVDNVKYVMQYLYDVLQLPTNCGISVLI